MRIGVRAVAGEGEVEEGVQLGEAGEYLCDYANEMGKRRELRQALVLSYLLFLLFSPSQGGRGPPPFAR